MQRNFSPMNAAELMDSVIDVYRKSFGKQIAFAAIAHAVLLAGIFAFAIVFTFAFVLLGLTALMDNSVTSGTVIVILVGAFTVILPIMLVWSAFTVSGHIMLSRQAFYGHSIRIEFKKIFKSIFCVITTILAQIILFIPIVAFLCVVIYLFATEYLWDATAYAGIIGIIAVFFLIAVGIFIFSNIFSLAVAVAVFERRHFFGAIFRSWELVKPEFWRILGIRTIWTFVAFSFSFSAQMLSAVALPALSYLDYVMPSAIVGIAGIFVMFVTNFAIPVAITLLVAPLEGILPALIYFNRRIKSEGMDLEIRLEKLQVNPYEI